MADIHPAGLSQEEAVASPFIASMGIYVFKKDLMLKLLREQSKSNDFGGEIIPSAAASSRVMAYLFNGYWEDIGTIKSFFEANLALAQQVCSMVARVSTCPLSGKTDSQSGAARNHAHKHTYFSAAMRLSFLISEPSLAESPNDSAGGLALLSWSFTYHEVCAMQPPRFEFYDQESPIYTSPRFLPPAKVVKSIINDAIISHGSYLEECTVSNAIIGLRSRIDKNAVIEVMPPIAHSVTPCLALAFAHPRFWVYPATSIWTCDKAPCGLNATCEELTSPAACRPAFPCERSQPRLTLGVTPPCFAGCNDHRSRLL